MRTFSETADDPATRFASQLESALLAQALAETGGLPDERAKALLSLWLAGLFNAHAVALPDAPDQRGALEWQPEADGFRLVWFMPSGIACPLARLYQQENGTWAVLIVAGVRDDLIEAMAAAEWGVSRLCA
jgi:hypothetical protein